MSSAQHADATFRLSPNAVVTVLEHEAVVLDLQTKYFYSVNNSGWGVLQLFEAGTTRADVHRQCHAWGAPTEDVSAIDRLIDVLIDDQLAIAAPAAAAPAAATLSGAWSTPVIEKHKEPLQRIMVSAFDPSVPLAE